MNRSNKGFGLTGVLVTVIFLIVAAIFSASANSSTLHEQAIDSSSLKLNQTTHQVTQHS